MLPADLRDDSDGFAAWIASHAPPERPRPELLQRARLSFLSAVASEKVVVPRARRSFRALVLTLAAAAIVLVTFLPRAARWKVQLNGPVRFAEREYRPGEEERLAAALEGSGLLESLDSAVILSLGGELEMLLLAGASLALPVLPELDSVSPVDFELAHGETYLHTAPGYPGNPIRVRTGAGDVALHGTTVGVLADDLGTCLCVADGIASLTSPRLPDGRQEVGTEHTLRVYADPDRMAKIEPFPTDERSPESAHTRELLDYFRSF